MEIEDHLGLVKYVLSRMSLPPGRWDECYNEGLVGLWQATQRWRPDGGASFSNFAYQRIRGAVIDWMRSEKITTRYADPPKFTSLDAINQPTGSQNSNHTEWTHPALRDEELGFATAEARADLSRLYKAVDLLTPEQYHVIKRTYADGWIQAEIAREVGVVDATILNRKTAALKKLRKALEPT